MFLKHTYTKPAIWIIQIFIALFYVHPDLFAENLDLDLLAELNNRLNSLVSKVSPHVVEVKVKVPPFRLLENPLRQEEGFFLNIGTGVVRNSNDRQIIITTESLVRNGTHFLAVDSEGKRRTAFLLAKDYISNIAVLSYYGPSLQSIKEGDIRTLKENDGVLAIGYPFLKMDPRQSLGKLVSVPEMTSPPQVCRFIRSTVPVCPGYLGAPLIDSKGNWIGLITAYKDLNRAAESVNDSSDIPEMTAGNAGAILGKNHVSLAVPVNTITYVVDRLLAGKSMEYGSVGITSELFTSENYDGKITDHELVIKKVRTGGAADNAGIKPGDTILGINEDKTISWFQLVTDIINSKPGDKIFLTLKREEQIMTLPVKVQNREGDDTGLIQKNKVIDPFLDVVAQPVILSRGQTDATFGVQVSRVRNGPARMSGIRPGDVIISIQGRRITSPQHFQQIISQVRKEPFIEIQYFRDGIIKATKILIDEIDFPPPRSKFPTTTPTLQPESITRIPQLSANITILPLSYRDVPHQLGPIVTKAVRK